MDGIESIVGLDVPLSTIRSRNEVSVNHVMGSRISYIAMSHAQLVIQVESGHRLILRDEGQSCCERRYMTCDDDLPSYIGSRLVSVSVEEGPSTRDHEYDVHEVAFLRVSTDVGTIVVSTHNEHNGYYGGFDLRASLLCPVEIV